MCDFYFSPKPVQRKPCCTADCNAFIGRDNLSVDITLKQILSPNPNLNPNLNLIVALVDIITVCHNRIHDISEL